jgi:hypothetical protein
MVFFLFEKGLSDWNAFTLFDIWRLMAAPSSLLLLLRVRQQLQ